MKDFRTRESYTRYCVWIPSYATDCTNRNPERKDRWEKYREILADQVHPMTQTFFPVRVGIFQDDNAPIHITGLVQSWYDEHMDEVKHLPCPVQSPDLQYN
ncbi:DDE_3 domain-containing protein [Trichonephila clavipes]|nr:DDE_3 domain-containing protein [Trichonephila clavipes]